MALSCRWIKYRYIGLGSILGAGLQRARQEKLGKLRKAPLSKSGAAGVGKSMPQVGQAKAFSTVGQTKGPIPEQTRKLTHLDESKNHVKDQGKEQTVGQSKGVPQEQAKKAKLAEKKT